MDDVCSLSCIGKDWDDDEYHDYDYYTTVILIMVITL